MQPPGRKAAIERAEAYRVHLEWALSHTGKSGRPITCNASCRKAERTEPFHRRWVAVGIRLGLPTWRADLGCASGHSRASRSVAISRAGHMEATPRCHDEANRHGHKPSIPYRHHTGLASIEGLSQRCGQAKSYAPTAWVAVGLSHRLPSSYQRDMETATLKYQTGHQEARAQALRERTVCPTDNEGMLAGLRQAKSEAAAGRTAGL